MWSLQNNKEFQYGICLNLCECLENKKTNKNYKLDKGSLVKFFRAPKSSCFNLIDNKLFKYLNAINDSAERLKFYRNIERREFVLHLEKGSIVSVDFSNGKQTKAVFYEVNEKEEEIFIIVELLENPPSQIIQTLNRRVVGDRYSTKHFLCSLPANMIRTLAAPDIDQKFEQNLQIDKTLWRCQVCFTENLKDTKRCTLCLNSNDVRNIFENNDQSFAVKPKCSYQENVRICKNVQKSVSIGVKPTKKRISSQNPVGRDPLENYHEPRLNQALSSDGKPCEILTGSDLTVSSSSSIETSIKSWVCDECYCSNVGDRTICHNCGEKNDRPIGHNNLQTEVTNEVGFLIHKYERTVRRNSSASKCVICQHQLEILNGFILHLCKHTFCAICIKKQITLENLARTNNKPCCERSIELKEIKYFLTASEYEQFKTSLIDLNETNFFIQRCLDKNCSGYRLWEEHYEDRPTKFSCNKCELDNCLQCGVIHVGLTCGQI